MFEPENPSVWAGVLGPSLAHRKTTWWSRWKRNLCRWNKHQFGKILCTLAAMQKTHPKPPYISWFAAGACVFFFIILLAVRVFWGCSCILMFRPLFAWRCSIGRRTTYWTFFSERYRTLAWAFHIQKHTHPWWLNRTENKETCQNWESTLPPRFEVNNSNENACPLQIYLSLVWKTPKILQTKNIESGMFSVLSWIDPQWNCNQRVVVRMRGWWSRNPARENDWNTISKLLRYQSRFMQFTWTCSISWWYQTISFSKIWCWTFEFFLRLIWKENMQGTSVRYSLMEVSAAAKYGRSIHLMIWFSWWTFHDFLEGDTVDGPEIRRAPVEVDSWNPIIYRVLCIPMSSQLVVWDFWTINSSGWIMGHKCWTVFFYTDPCNQETPDSTSYNNGSWSWQLVRLVTSMLEEKRICMDFTISRFGFSIPSSINMNFYTIIYHPPKKNIQKPSIPRFWESIIPNDPKFGWCFFNNIFPPPSQKDTFWHLAKPFCKLVQRSHVPTVFTLAKVNATKNAAGQRFSLKKNSLRTCLKAI